MKRAAPLSLGAGGRLVGALIPGLVALYLSPIPLQAAQDPSWADGPAPEDFVVLQIVLGDLDPIKIATKHGLMASVRRPGGDLYLGFVPRVVDAESGRVEIQILELRAEGARPRAPRIVRQLDNFEAQVGHTAYVSPLDIGELLDVTVTYVGRDPWRPMGIPPRRVEESRSSGPPQPAPLGCCLQCDGVMTCGCAVGTSCGMCCQGCCRM